MWRIPIAVSTCILQKIPQYLTCKLTQEMSLWFVFLSESLIFSGITHHLVIDSKIYPLEIRLQLMGMSDIVNVRVLPTGRAKKKDDLHRLRAAQGQHRGTS